MRPEEVYNLINKVTYKTTGDSVDYWIGYVAEEKKVYVLFQGSNQKRDWQINFKFPVKPYKHQENKFYVAKGWGDAYKSANDVIMRELSEALSIYSPCGVVFAGHSLGGVMAILAAEDFNYRTSFFADVITFGSPKPIFGFHSYAYFVFCVKDCINYEHVNDIVPTVPPFPGYRVLEPKKIGEYKFLGKFKPQIYHMMYGDPKLYH